MDAKNYPNTIELSAEKWYKCITKRKGGVYPCWKKLNDEFKDTYKQHVIDLLDSVGYFEGKHCSDCGYLDKEKGVCFGEDREHNEVPESPICESFTPVQLVKGD